MILLGVTWSRGHLTCPTLYKLVSCMNKIAKSMINGKRDIPWSIYNDRFNCLLEGFSISQYVGKWISCCDRDS